MSEIKINAINLDAEIGSLRELKGKIASNKKNAPVTVGGGETIKQIEKLGDEYRTMEDKMESLLQNTISFMSNIQSSYATSDNNASKTFK